MLRVIGIDFGTSTTYMNVKRYNGDKPVEDRFSYMPVMFNYGESSGNVASIVRENADGTFDFGEKAAEKLEGSRIYTEFKMLLESPDGDKRAEARRITAEFFKFLYETYAQQASNLGDPGDEVETLISYPVKWQPETAEFMLSAARAAGFRNVSGTDEATAAVSTAICRGVGDSGLLSAAQPGYLLLIDMGAGTTDLALCKYLISPGESDAINAENISIELVTAWPESENEPTFGGREIDAVLTTYVEDFLKGALDPALASMARSIAAMPGQAKMWKERNVSANLAAGKPVTSCGYISAYSAMLSGKFPTFGREDFAKIVKDGLSDYVRLVEGCLQKASETDAAFASSGLDLVILTGGHSSWYFAREIIDGAMEGWLEHPALAAVRRNKERVVSLPNPQATVALGLVYNRLLSSLKIKRADSAADDWITDLPDNDEEDWLNDLPDDDSDASGEDGGQWTKQDIYNDILVYAAAREFTRDYTFARDANFGTYASVFADSLSCLNAFRFKGFFKNRNNDICLCCEKSVGSASGFAVCQYGIYYETVLTSSCIPWPSFILNEIALSGKKRDKISIGAVTLPVNNFCVTACFRYFKDLQERLRKLFRI